MKLKLANLEKNKVLGPLTTYKIGGPADYFVAVRKIDELIEYHSSLPNWDNQKGEIESEIFLLIEQEFKVLTEEIAKLNT